MICPKCGVTISRFDLKPNCKNCGVNLTYYTQEKELTSDAKRAELEFAQARIFVARLKAAYIGGKLQIARLTLSVLCTAVLVIPFASATFSAPLISEKLSVGALGVYGLIGDGLLPILFKLTGIELVASITVRMLALYAVFVLLALMAVAVLLTEFTVFINTKKTARLMCAFSGAGVALSAVITVMSFAVSSFADTMSYLEVSVGAGGFAAAVMFAAMLVVNIPIAKNGIHVKIK